MSGASLPCVSGMATTDDVFRDQKINFLSRRKTKCSEIQKHVHNKYMIAVFLEYLHRKMTQTMI